MSEADTCRKYIVPKLYKAGWDDDHIREQVPITDGRIMPIGQKQFQRKNKLKPDYILDYLQAKVDVVHRHQTTTQRELDVLLPAILDKAFNGSL